MTVMDRLRALLRAIFPRDMGESKQGKPILDKTVIDDAQQQRERLRLVISERQHLDEMVVREFRARAANDIRRK